MRQPKLPAILVVAICCFAHGILAANSTLTSKDGHLQIQVPDGYSEKTPLKPTIKIEAVNGTGATVMVISDNQSQFASLAEYAEIVRNQMTARLKDPESDAGEKIEAGGNPAIRYEITGISTNGQRMAFLVTVIQTETRFNQVTGACARAKFADRKQEFVGIANTLKELRVKAGQ